MQVRSLGGEDPLEKEMQPIPVFFLGNPMDRGAWRAIDHTVEKIGHDLGTEQQQQLN